MIHICRTCKTSFVNAQSKAVYCSVDCRTFYQTVGIKFSPELMSDAKFIQTEDDYKDFIREYFYMKNGNLNYQLLSSPLLSSYLGVDPLKYANQHNSEESVNTRVLVWLHDVKPTPCITCGARTSVEIKKSIPSYRKYCSEECYAQSMKLGGEARKVLDKTILDKYGVENVFQDESIKGKARLTMLQRFGVEHIMQSEEGRQLFRDSVMEKYGVEHPMQLEEIKRRAWDTLGARSWYATSEGKAAREKAFGGYQGGHPMRDRGVIEKIISNNLKRYGVEWPAQDPVIKAKVVDTMLEKYGVSHPLQIPEVKARVKQSHQTKYGRFYFNRHEVMLLASERSKETCVRKYGVPYALQNKSMWEHITSSLNSKSKPEIEISDWLTSMGVTHKCSDFTLLNNMNCQDGGTRRQIDIYCPEHKLAIEFNGLYWHSEIHKYRRYHLEKTEACEAQGVQLIHVWEDEWYNKPDVVKGMLAAKLGIKKPSGYARQCYVEEGKKSDILELLASQHIQGTIHSATHYLLLRDKRDNRVRAVMTFIKRVVKGEQCMELTRFASDGIHGAFSKLLAYYKEHLWDGVKTFSFGDRCVVSRLSNIYLSHGFVEEEIQDPDYKYHKPGTLMREHKFGFRKADFAQMGYDVEGKTEDQLATEAGLVRIWNCGLIKYVLN